MRQRLHSVLAFSGVVTSVLILGCTGEPDAASPTAAQPLTAEDVTTPVSSPEPLTLRGEDAPESCPVSQRWRLAPPESDWLVNDSATGDGRVIWMSRLPVTHWGGPTYLNSVRWLVSSQVTEDIEITGRRLDGEGMARFSSLDDDEQLTERLRLPALHDYSDSGYVVTPTPGCWRFDVTAGDLQTQITVYFQGTMPPASCPVSPSAEVKPSIAPGIGEGGVWMVSGQAVQWLGADVPMKTIWLIDESITGDVRITGERIDGEGTALFGYDVQLDSVVGSSVEETNRRNRERLLEQSQPIVVFEPPHSIGRDRRGFIIYPAPGCYRFTVQTALGKFEIVQYLNESEEKR